MSGYRLTGKEEHFYAVTKHGVKVITEGTRVELRELGSHIRVTVLHPLSLPAHGTKELRLNKGFNMFEYLCDKKK